MKILSIRLNPFGGTTDRTYTLQDGLNVLEGPNEFGKSTLSKALWHAIFTSTKLTPKKLQETMGRWYPQPDGDHVRVTLRFEVAGNKWTLEKTWGAGSSARLQADGAASIADASSVQERLDALRRLDEATWRYVLFTGQAELARTADALRENAHQLDDVHSLLKGAAAIPGDIAPEKLRSALQERIAAHNSRWDLGTNGPEAGRGIDNPWKNRLGPVVQAYYEQEMTRRECDEVLRYEQELDAVNGRIARVQEAMQADAEFVTAGNRLRDGLSRREVLSEKRERLAGEEKRLMDVFSVWPGIETVITSKEQELSGIGETLEDVQAELRHAQQRAGAEQLRRGYEQLIEAKNKWEAAAKTLAATTAVDEQQSRELQHLQRRLEDLDIKLAAQKLAAKLHCSTPLSVTLHRGTDAAETLMLTPGAPWEGEASGRFRLEFADLTLSVQSGQENVDVLFEQRTATLKRRDELLGALGKDNLAAVEQADKEFKQLAEAESRAQDLYQVALRGKTLEQWTQEMDLLMALPQTRDLATLENARDKLINKQAEIKAAIDQDRQKVMQWNREYGDTTQLFAKMLNQKEELTAAARELGGLPELPPGYATVSDYLNLLRQKQQRWEELQQELQTEKLEHAGLMARTPDRTAEDLRADLELAEREFKRQLATGAALRRIETKLEAILAARGDGDPLQGLTAAISNHFGALTDGRYTAVQLVETAPVRVAGPISLDTLVLSQGTLGSLALATRLALAELYLATDKGFVMLDDPFTDMDPVRRIAAAKAIGLFAQQRQVLVFTCHPLHHEELVKLAGAEPVLYAAH